MMAYFLHPPLEGEGRRAAEVECFRLRQIFQYGRTREHPSSAARRGGVNSFVAQVFQWSSIGIAGSVKSCMDPIEHAIDILPDFVIPESDYTISFGLKPTRSFIIFRLIDGLAMLRTVKL